MKLYIIFIFKNPNSSTNQKASLPTASPRGTCLLRRGKAAGKTVRAAMATREPRRTRDQGIKFNPLTQPRAREIYLLKFMHAIMPGKLASDEVACIHQVSLL